jgi:hypothetical protein
MNIMYKFSKIGIFITNNRLIAILPLARRAYASERIKWPQRGLPNVNAPSGGLSEASRSAGGALTLIEG